MQVHLVDGTYELFRQFYGQPAREGSDGTEIAAVRGVLQALVSMLDGGATHLGVATDHVIESFRNELWPGYKTSAGVPAELLAQFPLLEEAIEAMGVVVWPMVELEADDALASAAAVAEADAAVERAYVWTPDKDLAQTVRGTRIVQFDRRKEAVIDEDAVRDRYGVGPSSIPDWLALVGDSADGFPGIAGWGKRSASSVLAHYEHIDAIPATAVDWEPGVRRVVRNASTLALRLSEELEQALLFRVLATLRIEPWVLSSVSDLAWHGPTPGFDDICAHLRDPALADRVAHVHARR